MNIHLTQLRTWPFVFLMGVLLPLLQSCQTTNTPPVATGMLVLVEELGPDKFCKIPIEHKIFNENDNGFGGCGFTWIGGLWLENTSSAVTLEFVDKGNNCTDHDTPRHSIIVKTTGFSGTPYRFTFTDILATAPGEVVKPGLRLIAKTTAHTGLAMNRNVGCIIMSPSD